MTLIQVWGCLLIFILCPLLGGLPAAEWLIRRLPRSIAFVSLPTVITVVVEASKGVACVVLARYYFPTDPTWWLIVLIALACGQFWLRQSKQRLGMIAGCLVYSWQITFLMLLMGGIGMTLLRERRLGRMGLLVLFPIIVGLSSQQSSQVVAAVGLSSLLAWVDDQLPDVSPSPVTSDAPGSLMTISMAHDAHLFGFFRRDRNIRTLDHPLNADRVGPMAATLSQLKALGHPIPPSWVLPPGDDADPLIQLLNPSPGQPLMIRPGLIGTVPLASRPSPEPIYQITSRRGLAQVIGACRTAYSATPATPHSADQGVAVMVQVQVQGQYSGVVWSQDIPNNEPDTVVISGGPGSTPAEALTSPLTTQMRVTAASAQSQALIAPQTLPLQLLYKIATMARSLECHCQGIPQQIEWSDDGSTLWILAVSAIQP